MTAPASWSTVPSVCTSADSARHLSPQTIADYCRLLLTIAGYCGKSRRLFLPDKSPEGPRTGFIPNIYPNLVDTINRAGEKFGPVEVEEAIRSHPAVSDVAVAGIADEEMGQRVGAAVVARSAVTLEELRSHCRELIAYFKLPERLTIVGHIPYNDTGKINRHQLAELTASGT
jgi:acyl-CoA synthetase (AMP-forming)/AMP-acid ligase II